MVSTHEKSDVVQLYDWSRPYSCSHLRAGNRKSVENAKRIRIMDTTDKQLSGIETFDKKVSETPISIQNFVIQSNCKQFYSFLGSVYFLSRGVKQASAATP